MTSGTYTLGAVFAVYLCLVLAIGARFFRRRENTCDYFLGERRLNKWVAALSAGASDMSGWLLIGLPGAAYLSGVSASWIAVGLLAGTYLNWLCVARRLRLYTGVSDRIITLSDYLEHRFRDESRLLRVVSALFILIFFLLYTSSGFVAGARLFNTAFGLDYTTALVLGAGVVVAYTFLGGFNAVCWTDLFQGLLMLAALVAAPLAAAVAVAARDAAPGPALDPSFHSLFGDSAGAGAVFVATVSSLAWGLGYFGQPHILVRFMAVRSPDEIPHARRIAMTWVTLSLCGAVAVGLIGRVYLLEPLEGPEAEKVFMILVDRLFPAVLAGVVLSAILAAIMSTADSQLLVTASAITEDFYRSFLRRKAGDAELVWTSRFTVVMVALAAAIFASRPDRYVFELVAYAWAGFGAAFGPVIVLSLYWRRMNRHGALAGMITGGLTALIWRDLQGGVFDLYEIVPGCLASTLSIIVASRLSAPPPDAVRDEFDAVARSAAGPNKA